MRHAQLLGARDPLMWRLVPALTREMGQAYPELVRAETLITETLSSRRPAFARRSHAASPSSKTRRVLYARGGVFSGETAFKLYDTYGFPLDLTQDALRARGLGVDVDAFNVAMERQRAEARRAWAGSGETATETVWYGLRERVGATEFLGYETETAEGIVQAIVKDGLEVDTAGGRRERLVILNQTPFYGEIGRPGRRRRRDHGAELPRRGARDAQEARRPLRPRRSGVEEAHASAWRSSFPSIMRRARRRAPTIPRPTSFTRPCGSCLAITWRKRARWSRPSGCASTSPIPRRSRR